MTETAAKTVLRFAAAAVGAATLSACAAVDLVTERGGASPIETGDFATASIPGAPTAVETGVAAWNGDVSSPGLTAAHPTMPIGSWARVTNAATGQSAVVRITQRLVGGRGRDLELSRDAAAAVGALHEGLATVLIEPIDPRQAAPQEQFWAADPQPAAPAAPAAVVPTADGSRPWDPNIATASIPAPDLGGPLAAGEAYYLQLGSFRDAGNADRLVSALRGQSLATGSYGQPFVQASRVGSRMFHRVRLGPIATPIAAEQALRDARALGHTDATILRR